MRLRPDFANVRPYYPWPGTRALDICRDNGWVHPRGEEQYHHDRAGLDIPACRPEQVHAFIRRLRYDLPAALGDPWWRRWPRTALAQLFRKRR